jgi:DNA-binding IclR family transcriptional regulator
VSAQPYLNNISRTLNESSSLAVLEDGEVLYVARAATSRVMSVALNTGSRLPAYCTSLGRVMLAHLPPDQLDAYLEHTRLRPMTPNTIVNPKRLREVLAGVRRDGYAINDEELELGLRSIAVPVRGASGTVLAALNVGAQRPASAWNSYRRVPARAAKRRAGTGGIAAVARQRSGAGRIHRTHALRLPCVPWVPACAGSRLRPVGGTATLRTSGGCRS